MSIEEPLLSTAQEIEQHLRAIRGLSRATLQADRAQSALTPPQMHALEILVRSGPMSLKALSRHMGLAHSTVSGIVDRLQRQGFARREIDPADRRGTRISITEQVADYLERQLPVHRLAPLLAALEDATADERKRVLDGLATLHRLLKHRATSEDTDAK